MFKALLVTNDRGFELDKKNSLGLCLRLFFFFIGLFDYIFYFIIELLILIIQHTMANVGQLLSKNKEGVIHAVSPHQLVIEALELMSAHNIGVVLVMEGDQLAGIFSERDYARKGVIQGRHAATTAIQDVMTSKVYTVTRQQSINDCMALMSQHKFRHLPVVEDNQVLGVVSVGDIVTSIINEQSDHIHYLEKYISGT